MRPGSYGGDMGRLNSPRARKAGDWLCILCADFAHVIITKGVGAITGLAGRMLSQANQGECKSTRPCCAHLSRTMVRGIRFAAMRWSVSELLSARGVGTSAERRFHALDSAIGTISSLGARPWVWDCGELDSHLASCGACGSGHAARDRPACGLAGLLHRAKRSAASNWPLGRALFDAHTILHQPATLQGPEDPPA
jgi:hypothetical protein